MVEIPPDDPSGDDGDCEEEPCGASLEKENRIPDGRARAERTKTSRKEAEKVIAAPWPKATQRDNRQMTLTTSTRSAFADGDRLEGESSRQLSIALQATQNCAKRKANSSKVA